MSVDLAQEFRTLFVPEANCSWVAHLIVSLTQIIDVVHRGIRALRKLPVRIPVPQSFKCLSLGVRLRCAPALRWVASGHHYDARSTVSGCSSCRTSGFNSLDRPCQGCRSAGPGRDIDVEAG